MALPPETEGRWIPFADTTHFARTAHAVDRLLDTITSDQWTAPTPCTQWNLAQLTQHLIDVNHSVATQINATPGPANDSRAGSVVARYRTSTEALHHALDTKENDGHGLSAQLRGRLALRVADLLIHGWDIARATGQPAHMPEDVTAEALAFAHRRIGALRRSGQFAEPQPVDDHAPTLDRLAALSGRSIQSENGV